MPEPISELTMQAVLFALRGFKFDVSTELRLQLGISEGLRSCGIAHSREVLIGPVERIDFLIGRIGMEVKIDGSSTEVARQLMRYMQSPRIDSLILFTTRARHAELPDGLGGKPLRVHWQSGCV